MFLKLQLDHWSDKKKKNLVRRSDVHVCASPSVAKSFGYFTGVRIYDEEWRKSESNTCHDDLTILTCPLLFLFLAAFCSESVGHTRCMHPTPFNFSPQSPHSLYSIMSLWRITFCPIIASCGYSTLFLAYCAIANSVSFFSFFAISQPACGVNFTHSRCPGVQKHAHSSHLLPLYYLCCLWNFSLFSVTGNGVLK